MSIIKGIIKYLFILIGLIVAVGIITLGIMYFFPSVNLFGYHFYKGNNSVQYISAYSTTHPGGADHIIKVDENIASDFDVLIVKADGFDINITTYETASSYAPLFQYRFTSNMKGLKKLEDAVPQVNVQTKNMELVQGEGLQKILQFDITEPRGLFIRNNTTFDLELPDNSMDFKKLIIESKSGTVVIGDEYDTRKLSISNVNVLSASGKVYIRNTQINSQLDIKKTSGSFYLQNDIAGNVNINCKNGKYSFVDLSSNVSILGQNADIKFNNVGGNVSVRMDYGLVRAETISGELSSLSNPNTGKSNNCDIKISKVLKSVLVDNSSGNIQIGQVSQLNDISDSSQINITTKGGDIKVGNCYANKVTISATRGDVSLSNCRSGESMNVSTTYGNIYVNFLETQTNVNGQLVLETARNGSGDGSIEVKNIRCQATLKAGNEGKIKATFKEIIGSCDITSNRGSVNVVVPNSAHLLKWKASKSADISVFDMVTSLKDSKDVTLNAMGDGWISIYSASSTTQNKLNILSKNSSVKIIDITRS